VLIEGHWKTAMGQMGLCPNRKQKTELKKARFNDDPFMAPPRMSIIKRHRKKFQRNSQRKSIRILTNVDNAKDFTEIILLKGMGKMSLIMSQRSQNLFCRKVERWVQKQMSRRGN
jgi:hypothetical protein